MNLIDRDELIANLKKDPLFPLVEQYGLTSVIEAQPVLMNYAEYVLAKQMLSMLAKRLDEAVLNGVSE
jgi:hypothetical protein